MFDLQYMDRNNICFSVISKDLFSMLKNITTLVGILCKDCGFKCILYGWSIIINLLVSTRLCCGGYG